MLYNHYKYSSVATIIKFCIKCFKNFFIILCNCILTELDTLLKTFKLDTN